MWVFTINPQLRSWVGRRLLRLFEELQLRELTTSPQITQLVYFPEYHANVCKADVFI